MTLTSGGVRRAVIAGIVILALVAGALWGIRRINTGRNNVRYISRPVSYTDISATVSETGTVNPVDPPGLVQVGSQVSGTIAAIRVDYNSRVKKGDVLATLDPTTFQAAVEQFSANLAAAQSSAAATQSAVTQAQAGVQTAQANFQQAQASLRSAQANATKAKAQLALANLTVSRDASLLQQGFIPQNQMDTDRTAAEANADDSRAAQAAVGVAQAQANAAASQVRSAQTQVATAQAQAAASQHQVASAAAQVQTAQYNLSRTVITSPMDGIVMARNVAAGQTVAASFQTPTLFTIATNLTDMQVDTSVDEADVGNVKAGEKAHISVTAFPNITFDGVVHEVRLNPTIVQNVVTYDAVVIVHDQLERLRPGMTAQVKIDVATRTHVLAVPLAALLYRPLGQGGAAQGATGGGGFVAVGGGGFGPPVASTPTAAPVAGAPGSQVTVWVLRSGRPSPVRVVIGLSDGQNVEITGGPLQEGDRVIIAQARGPARGGQGAGGGPNGGGGPGRAPGP
ncbi:MAG TPA: efflux RND transporter periplasmic adaptor subunit [bacterium]|nr:efflux RND transporter periplasmic adaptor subunit [bacterium]